MSGGGVVVKKWNPTAPSRARCRISGGMLAPVVGSGICCFTPTSAGGRNEEGNSFVGTATTRPISSSNSMSPWCEAGVFVPAAKAATGIIANAKLKKHRPPDFQVALIFKT